MAAPVPAPLPQQPKWLDHLAAALAERGYVATIATAYVACARRYILFHQLRHPKDLGGQQVAAFLNHLAGGGPPDLQELRDCSTKSASRDLAPTLLRGNGLSSPLPRRGDVAWHAAGPQERAKTPVPTQERGNQSVRRLH